MKTISIINMKGGVGKTTLAFNTAYELSLKAKTLLVDIDPQFNATQYALGSGRTESYIEDKAKKSVLDVFDPGCVGEKDSPIIRNIFENLDILPSALKLNKVLRNPYGKERQLSNFLKSQSHIYRYVIIDCPPTDSVLTDAAYFASDYLLIPVCPEFLSTIGLPLLLESYHNFIRGNPESKLQIAGIIINNRNAPNKQNVKNNDNHESLEDIRAFAKDNKINLFETSISYAKKYSEGARAGKPIQRTKNAFMKYKINLHEFISEFRKVIGDE